MATKSRGLYRGGSWHVTVRAVDGRTLFLDDLMRLAFLGQLGRVVEERALVCVAYCLMTNHFHLLVRTPEDGLPEAMQRLNTWLAVTFNRQIGRRGRVLEAPYRTRAIETERHLLGVARYVPLNPFRAGMVERVEDHPWSSYRATAGIAPCPTFLSVDWLLAQLGGREGYTAFVDRGRRVRSIDEILLEP
jgi:putative transposase